MSRYEAVIGLEIHAQLATRTKIFSGAPVEFGAEPNTNVTPLCLGLPGTLPVLNRNVVSLAMRMALAVGCTIQERSRFLRKNYFYPDLPKGYQISQYQSNDEMPLATGGGIHVRDEDGGDRFIRLVRIHMEEDAGKSIHDEEFIPPGESMIDYNRTGTPLIEIVSEPDMRSPAEAAEFVTRLREILVYSGASQGDMEKGHVRIDANVSIRERGETTLGTKVEIKNMNSIRNCQRALELEILRQEDLVDSGGSIVQQTMLFDAASETLRAMRTKEDSDDYRYFPDPDLVPIVVDDAWIEEVRAQVPELPNARRERFVAEFALPSDVVEILTSSRDVADYFEAVVSAGADVRKAANWVQGDVLRRLNDQKEELSDLKVTPAALAEIIALVDDGKISANIARKVFDGVAETGEAPAAVVEREGLVQVSDAGDLEGILDDIIGQHPEEFARLKDGDRKLTGFFMGQVMKATRGQANPKVAGDLLTRKLQ